VLGSTGYRNLFLNTGHGTLGWTMACGSGRVVTDILGGRAPDIDLSGLTLERF
jgi:D-amino-acid dehydrogenase